MRIIIESVLMVFPQNYNYQNQSILVETKACQSCLVSFETQHSVIILLFTLQCTF